MAAEVRVRQVRVLIYEGPAEEVRRMVTAEGRYVYGRREVGKTLISEYLAPAETIPSFYSSKGSDEKVEGCF